MSTTQFVDENNVIRFSVDGKEKLAVAETLDLEKSEVLISLSGDLVNALALAFLDELNALASMDAKITLDLSELNYIGNLGVDALLDVQRQMDIQGKGLLTLTKVPPPILQELKRVGVADLLMIE